MSLLSLADVRHLLVCPSCAGELVEEEMALRCVSPRCSLAASGPFPIVGGLPALVDFDQSVLPRDEVLSLVGARRGKWSIDRLPARLRSWWKPQNAVAAENVALLLSLLPQDSPLVLVVGGGTLGNGVEAIYEDPRLRVAAFDLYKSSITQFIADAHQIPLADESVDAVVVQAVLEHVLDPPTVVREIHRVLRPRGLVYAETPFLQQVHAGPYDFVRYTSSGHRYLFRAFKEVAAGPVAGPGTQLLWSLDHIVRGLLRSELAGKLARAAFFWLRYADRLIPTEFAMDNASAYFFLGRRADHELRPDEVAAYYQGAQRVSAE